MTRSFVKWAGGKRLQAQDIVELIRSYRVGSRPFKGNYFEPFVGGGAVFFALRASNWRRKANLYDTNAELVCAYQVVRDSPDALIKRLRRYQRGHSPEFYMKIRTQKPSRLSDLGRAARMIYLNKTCFNGLWRENKKGQFNVPMGNTGYANICDEPRILAASIALAKTNIRCADFSRVWGRAKAGDVVYFDPPYLPPSDRPAFTGYTRDGFTMDDQIRLADLAVRLRKAHVHVIASGADTKETRELYESRGFHCKRVEIPRYINSNAAGRGVVGELLITGGE